MKALVSVFAALIAAFSLYSQNTITVNSVPSDLCVGTMVYVHFTATGTFNPGNQFTLEVSSSSGVFNGGVAFVGTNSDSIGFNITQGFTVGEHYRIRVRASNPIVIGAENGSDIVIHARPNALALAATNAPLTNTDLQLLGSGYGGTGNYVNYQWSGPNGFVSFAQNPVIQNIQTANSGTYALTITDDAGCVSFNFPGNENPFVNLIVAAPALIQQQPQSQNIAAGTDISFTIVVSGTPTFQWMMSLDHGINWTDLVNNNQYQDVNTGSLHIPSAAYEMTGQQFKCLLNFPAGEIYSNASTLSIQNSTLITWVDSVSLCQNGPSQVQIPIKVKNFHEIGAIQLGLKFENAVLQYAGYTNLNPLIAQSGSFLINTFTLTDTSYDQTAISFYTLNTFDLPDSATLITLIYNITGQETDLVFPVPDNEYGFSNGSVVPALFKNGHFHTQPCQELEGYLNYKNNNLTPMRNVTIRLKQNDLVVYSTVTDSTGLYHFSGVLDGQYQVELNSPMLWGGGSSSDALLAMRQFVGLVSLSGLNKKVADVDNSGMINTIDGLQIVRRFVGLINTFPVSDWKTEPDVITVGGGNPLQVQNIKALCTGDINGSYIPE